jgi:hypothetical protein
MKTIRQEVGKSATGERRFKYIFVHEVGVNRLVNAQSYFTKTEKVVAKNKHKKFLKK